ncbi:MAG TPA: hypothetical protein VLA17_10100 [Candidatus Limnocylindria bacterium]|nr:hypothetical protein [Candidatus Limnocylindria bacterium]
MPRPPEIYRTPKRKRGVRSAATNPRPGEMPDRGGQKEYIGYPDGMKPTGKLGNAKVATKKAGFRD